MDPLYELFKTRTLQLASRLPKSDFHKAFDWAHDRSSRSLGAHDLLLRIHGVVSDAIDDDLGHGLPHTETVTRDAGSLLLVEGKAAGLSETESDRLLVLTQCAGLLHDIKRKETDHSVAGAIYAETLLKSYAIPPDEIQDICVAIRNHEAFKSTVDAASEAGQMVSDCLYDADKFQWGLPNFTKTIWRMVSYHNTPVEDFMAGFPKAMAFIAKIRTTFRTATGRKYGPAIIDQGLTLGNMLYRLMNSEFGL